MSTKNSSSNHNFFPILSKAQTGSAEPLLVGLGAYVAILINDTGKAYQEALERGCDNDTLRAFLEGEHRAAIEAVSAVLAGDFESDELREFILSGAFIEEAGIRGGGLSTPHCISQLAIRALDIHDGDTISDLCCGIGGFLINATRAFEVNVCGIEKNRTSAMMAKAALMSFDQEGEIEIGDALEGAHSGSFDKVFSNFPFGMRLDFFSETSKYSGIANLGKKNGSADWLFALAAHDALKDTGKAFVIMTNGSLNNSADKSARRLFIENGMVETVIALPNNLFQGTCIPVTAMILSMDNNSVRMVDASDLYVAGRRRNSLGKDEIDEILERIRKDGTFSCTVARETLENCEYDLCPAHYQGRTIELDNPTPLGEVSLSIERGASYRADELDALTTLEDTGYSYLKIGDIVDGVINEGLTNLIELDPKTSKQWLRTGDLVISKSAAPFKIAVVDIAEERKVLATGNLFIVRLDPNKADPYYVAAFLTSEDGKDVLSREVTGTAILSLPAANLKRMKISLPSLEKQKRIGALYRTRLEEIEALRIKLNKARVAVSEAYFEAVER